MKKKNTLLIIAGLALAATGLTAQVTSESAQTYWNNRLAHPNDSDNSWSDYYGYFRDDAEALAILDHLDANGLDSLEIDSNLLVHLLRGNPSHSSAVSLAEEILNDGLWKPKDWGYRVVRDILLKHNDSYDVTDFAGEGFASKKWRRIVMNRARQMSDADAIALLQAEKDGLAFAPDRSEAQNEWMTQVSATLMALKLDQ